MRIKKIGLFCMGLMYCSFTNFLSAQTENFLSTIHYKIETFGSAASGDYTPAWLANNRYGTIPLKAGNGYVRPAVSSRQSFGKGFFWEAGIDMIVSAPRYRNVYLQQLYLEIGYKSLSLSVGSKEQYHSLWDRRLSSGDMVLSANARPIPEINLGMPVYSAVPFTGEWLQVKGDFAVGRSFDKAYLKNFTNDAQIYVDKTLWHHKSGYVRIKDIRNHFPVSLEIGVQHWAQWGGTSTDPKVGKQPQTLKDFIRIIVGKEGGEGATTSDLVNALGNHYGSYDFRLGFSLQEWSAHAYYQHYFDDKSGMRFENKLDGLWGIQIDVPKFSWLTKVVIEHLNTKDQSGPFHLITFDREKFPGRGGGSDNYYNNGEYTTGASYFNRSLGSPLLQSPEYNTDGSLGFKSNRVKAWHIGFEGAISTNIAYRLLLTDMSSWGTHARPFLNRKSTTSGLLELTYRHPRLKGWTFTGSIAGDTGSYFDKGIGLGIGIVKSGFLTELLP